MKGFTEIHTAKVKHAITNYNKVSSSFRELEKNIESQIEEEVKSWGWLAKFYYCVDDYGSKTAWLKRHGGMYYYKLAVYNKKGKITAEQRSAWSNHNLRREECENLKALLDAGSKTNVQIGEKLAAWVNTYSKEMHIE